MDTDVSIQRTTDIIPRTASSETPEYEEQKQKDTKFQKPAKILQREYTIAWICTRLVEVIAAKSILDASHDHFSPDLHDLDAYILGRIGTMNVVIFHAESSNLDEAITRLRWNFPSINTTLFVGIGDSVPGPHNPRLGDVVVATAALKFELSERVEGNFELKDVAEQTLSVGQAVRMFKASNDVHQAKIPIILQHMARYDAPDVTLDVLLCSRCELQAAFSCESCDELKHLRRVSRSSEPRIHYGKVAVTDKAIANASQRDMIAQKLGIVCIDTNNMNMPACYPCYLIRGLSGYADTHDNRVWEEYAAGTAAACAKEFLRTLAVVDVSASVPVRPPMIPYPRNKDFIDRPEIFATIHENSLLMPDYQASALIGISGSGKTQIALEYAYRRHQSTNCPVFWISSSSEMEFRADLEAIASRTGLKAGSGSDDLLMAVQKHIESLPRWLVVIDDADDLTLLGMSSGFESKKNLHKYVPRGRGGNVLWTSRNVRVGNLVGAERVVSVGPMDIEQALNLLRLSTGNAISEQSPVDALKLIKELDWSPLAISQAGSFMRRQSISAREYLSLMEDNTDVLKAAYRQEDDQDGFDMPMPKSTLAIIMVSMDRLRQESETAYRVLKLIAHMGNGNIPVDLLTTAEALFNSEVEEELSHEDTPTSLCAIELLQNYSFLRVSKSEGKEGSGYRMHKLIQWAIRHQLRVETPNDEQYFLHTASWLVATLFQKSRKEKGIIDEDLVWHAFQHSEWAGTYKRQSMILEVLDEASLFFHDHNLWEKSEPIDERIVDLQSQSRSFGKRYPAAIAVMSRLAVTYRSRGRYGEAESLIRKALKLQPEAHGIMYPHTIERMSLLSSLYHAQGRHDKARLMSLEMLKMRQHILGNRHPDTIRSIVELAVTIYGQRQSLFDLITSDDKSTEQLRSMLETYVKLPKSLSYWEEEEPLVQDILANVTALFHEEPALLESFGRCLRDLNTEDISDDEFHGNHEHTVYSSEVSTFSRDPQSMATRSSTVAISHLGTKEVPRQISATSRSNDSLGLQKMEATMAELRESRDSYQRTEHATDDGESGTDDCDAETTYSIDSTSDDRRLEYLQSFAEQFIMDLKATSTQVFSGKLEEGCLDPLLKEFAWRLHAESSNPFQRESAVIIHKEREELIKLLIPLLSGHGAINGESDDSDIIDQFSDRPRYRKPRSMINQWLKHAEVSNTEPDSFQNHVANETDVDKSFEVLPRLQHYEFIRESKTYKWLIAKVYQNSILRLQKHNIMSEIGSMIRRNMRAHSLLRRMSSRTPSSKVKITFYFDRCLLDSVQLLGLNPPCHASLENIMCLTGSWDEAQASTVEEYMEQTWPRSGKSIITLLRILLSKLEGEECFYQIPESDLWEHKTGLGAENLSLSSSQLTACVKSRSTCFISATGGLYFVSEIGEQIGWLVSAFQSLSDRQGAMTCTPGIKNFRVASKKAERFESEPVLFGSCKLIFNFGTTETSDLVGTCWGKLVHNPLLICGYPILRRIQPNTGLEISLAKIASIIGSQQVVQWGKRIVIKGFNTLMIATLATADMIVWHLLTSERPGERISYTDPRLDSMNLETLAGIPLRMLENRRHAVGWCSEIDDLCGNTTANLNIEPSGLQEPPPSIVIDRLYIEAGADFVGGLNISFNQKNKPFWLIRENDYPDLLKWVSAQPILFYDVGDQRAWLTDGASALLHLVRVSLHLDQNDPESTYDWTFDASKFQDKRDGMSSRQAALKTLSNWDNLTLHLYVVSKKRRSDGEFDTEYATLQSRIKKLLHSIELLFDQQVMNASQNGIHIPQTFDVRKGIIGFDIRDIIDPLNPIRPRIKRIDSRGYGWADLISSIGTITIFGRGFGDLIIPTEAGAVCTELRFVPPGRDYMTASVSTLQMLYQRRLLRMHPGLASGDVTDKIMWISPNHPFTSCECVRRGPFKAETGIFHIDFVQSFVAKASWVSRFQHRESTPVDVMTLNKEGAVIFGHGSFWVRKIEGKFGSGSQLEDPDAASTTNSSEPETSDLAFASVVSTETVTTQPTAITSSRTSSRMGVPVQSETEDNQSTEDANQANGQKARRWRSLKSFMRK